MQTQFLEQLDGIFRIVVIAPAEEHQTTLLGQIHLESIEVKVRAGYR